MYIKTGKKELLDEYMKWVDFYSASCDFDNEDLLHDLYEQYYTNENCLPEKTPAETVEHDMYGRFAIMSEAEVTERAIDFFSIVARIDNWCLVDIEREKEMCPPGYEFLLEGLDKKERKSK